MSKKVAVTAVVSAVHVALICANILGFSCVFLYRVDDSVSVNNGEVYCVTSLLRNLNSNNHSR
ncbi:hypothetical protein PF010_g31430 [Phytophthora fragariae]|uniref:Uncharacterized protein n=1 Tax=Phytophthora fragariae TaxID=53985 RepID=A0A6G0JHW4_9STRA|nr:hypothetical protein PF010_g31430 [Phytophthora fragariae]